MAEPLITEGLWNVAEPLPPARPPDPRGGAPRKSGRSCLGGILHVLVTGCQTSASSVEPWKRLPPCGLWPGGITCWRRFTEWGGAGVWPRPHRELPNHPGKAGAVDPDRVAVDPAPVRAKKGARTPAPHATSRGRPTATRPTASRASSRRWSGGGSGKVRYVVERTVAWPADFRRIAQCYERTGEAWQAFNELACCAICARKLRKLNQRKVSA